MMPAACVCVCKQVCVSVSAVRVRCDCVWERCVSCTSNDRVDKVATCSKDTRLYYLGWLLFSIHCRLCVTQVVSSASVSVVHRVGYATT